MSAYWRYNCVSLVDKSYHPVVVAKVLGVPVPPDLVVPVYEVPTIVCGLSTPPAVMNRSPTSVVAKSFHSASASWPVEVLLVSHLMRPPALKK